MKTVETHLADVLAVVHPLSAIDLQLAETHGCVLAEDVYSPGPLPAFDNSAMDGYAVRSVDVAGATASRPVRLSVVGDVMAGSWQADGVSSGSCLRIMTGAPLPAGADAVVPLEWTDGGIAAVRIQQPASAGQHVRRVGEDVPAGQVVGRRGGQVHAAQLALLAAVGRDHALVHPRPRAVVLSTGDEVVEPGQPPRPGQIYDANGYALTASVTEAGGQSYRAGIVGDDSDRLMAILDDHLIRADLIITSGGVSVGERDVVKKALSKLGTVRFERVAMQPGMPQGFGTIGPDSTPIFCLPGNPVSALVAFEVFVRPAIRRMAGFAELQRRVVQARLLESLSAPAGKRQYRRAQLETEEGHLVVRPHGGTGSHLLAGLAGANALIVLDEDTTEVPEGSEVDVLVLTRAHR
ncbi:MAG: molybdopterin molybdotransferase MoeA [Actinomycetota bacterium]|nr:molybdopterin molybdotransferase MoeA [Actinomycetota bacterium]